MRDPKHKDVKTGGDVSQPGIVKRLVAALRYAKRASAPASRRRTKPSR
ncbi:MAG TPA: hypothetical protein VGM16_00805 [Gammaproteobacteria bacterium]|jgi:hypothetical protein